MPSVVQLLLNLRWYVLRVEESSKVELDVRWVFSWGSKDLPGKTPQRGGGGSFLSVFLDSLKIFNQCGWILVVNLGGLLSLAYPQNDK